jgi:hypothetical protein
MLFVGGQLRICRQQPLQHLPRQFIVCECRIHELRRAEHTWIHLDVPGWLFSVATALASESTEPATVAITAATPTQPATQPAATEPAATEPAVTFSTSAAASTAS